MIGGTNGIELSLDMVVCDRIVIVPCIISGNIDEELVMADRQLALALAAWIDTYGKIDPFYAAGEKFIKKGTYDSVRADKLFLNAVNRWYKSFAKDMMYRGELSDAYVDVPTRKLAAEKLRRDFEREHGISNPGIVRGKMIAAHGVKFRKDGGVTLLREGNPGNGNGNGWIPIHGIRFNEDSIDLFGAHTNPAKLGTGERFRKLKRQLAASGAYSPGGLARYIGVQKYGEKKFAELAAKGRRRAARRRRS